jgi:hypothetical protein
MSGVGDDSAAIPPDETSGEQSISRGRRLIGLYSFAGLTEEDIPAMASLIYRDMFGVSPGDDEVEDEASDPHHCGGDA